MILEIKTKISKARTAKPKIFKIDDEVFLQNQPTDIQQLINGKREGDTAEFDNATIRIYDSGRMVINITDYGI